MNDNDIIKALDILDKFEFFGGQRAGRELWFNKPADIQEKDIGDFNRDIDFLKAFINRLKAEIERFQKENSENFNKWLILDKRTQERYAELYEEAKGVVRTEAIKEFAEKTDKIIAEIYKKFIFGYDLEDEAKEAVMDFSNDISCDIDNIVKEMTEGQK